MAFNQQVDLSRLKANLLTSGLQQKDNPLFQVINQLIAAVEQNIGVVSSSISGGGGSGLINRTYVTFTNESASLPNSRRILAGNNIAFDSSVPNELTISSPNWDVLTDGDLIEAELIYAGGEVIMTHVP